MKWVLIVLLAGFIGQFGKSLAKYFMARGKSLKKEKSSYNIEQSVLQTNNDGRANGPLEVNDNKSHLDLADNAAKERAKEGKKALKTMAKQKKKEVKLLEKERK